MGFAKPKQRKREVKRAGPRPRTQPKAAAKPKCIRGHDLPSWARQDRLSCEMCRIENKRRAQIDSSPLWPGGGVPREMAIRETESGRLIRFAIPPHCRRRG